MGSEGAQGGEYAREASDDERAFHAAQNSGELQGLLRAVRVWFARLFILFAESALRHPLLLRWTVIALMAALGAGILFGVSKFLNRNNKVVVVPKARENGDD